ncbi:MAG: gas vesicle protein GvpN [Deltaproteobacteria bacterium]|nr:gas vesicle protein GvpN [Deltaproteobacteria bacterium]
MIEELTTVIKPGPLPDFVETAFVKDLTERALGYIRAGFPVHFRGASGTGKTTLALHVASRLGRQVILIHGDEQYTSTDLVGGEYGYHLRKVVDRFVSRVLKVEENMIRRWVDNRLTVACKYGFTLVYDEFTRSRPEANNILLSILQERVLDLPVGRGGEESYLRVHPDFTALFTSNPEEYAGVHRTQDALRDRMVTMDLDHFGEETEIAITQAKSGLARKEAERIVKVVRAVRAPDVCEFGPTIRGAIMIARSLAVLNGHAKGSEDLFRQVCEDIVVSETNRVGTRGNRAKVRELVRTFVRQYSQGDAR